MTYRQAFYEVLYELWIFLMRRPLRSVGMVATREVNTTSMPLLPEPVAVPKLTAPGIPLLPVSRGGVEPAAVVVVERARLWQRPVRSFDGVVTELLYGTPVAIDAHEGQFSYVRAGAHSGWVFKDHVVYDKTLVYPEMVIGEVYDAKHRVTTAIRRLLRDPFAAAHLYLPLLSAEYVTYELARLGRVLPWSEVRPRPVGQWHVLLRGARGVHVGIAPRTGSIMECLRASGEGYVAVVESVHPDGTIVAAGVGFAEDGVFARETLPPAVYRERKAVFIALE